MPPPETGFAIYQVPLSRTLIFSASGLYGFYSSAFPGNLLLSRKSFPENFRLWFASNGPSGFQILPKQDLKRTFPRVKERKAGRPNSNKAKTRFRAK
jgi:hypothetical protein